jgi:hypothetical protein
MNWLNIKLSTLRSPAYLGSNPVERATWLQLLAYCADQENGGRIAGAASWKDRQWQQTCGVTAREVRAASRLVAIEGEDVRVAHYPLEQEAEMKSKREKGRDAANRRWHGAVAEEPARGDGSRIVDGLPMADGSPIADGNAKGNEKERNGNEMQAAAPCGVQRTACAGDDGVGAGCAPVCLSPQAVEYGARLTPPCPEQWCRKWWEDSERRGWLGPDGLRIVKWQPALSSYWRGVQEMERRLAFANGGANGTSLPGGNSSGAVNGNGNGNGANGHAPQPPPRERAMSAYEINTRLGAIDDELSRLRIRAKDGRSEDGLRIVKIYAPEEEARRGQLLKAKEVLKRKLTEV